MKLEPLTKLYTRNMATSKKFDAYWQIVTSLPCFWFITNLKQFRSQIPDAWSVKLKISLTVTFYLTKTKSRIKKNSHTIALSKSTVIEKMLFFLQIKNNWKKANISKTKGILVKVYFLKLYMCVYLLTKFQVSSIIVTPKKPTLITVKV